MADYPQRIKNLFDRIYRYIAGDRVQYRGEARGLHGVATVAARHGDLEIYESPVRDAYRARILLEMAAYCPEVGTAVQAYQEDVVSSEDGDDQGIAIAPIKKKDKELPIDPQVEEIANDVITRLFGGDEIELIVKRLLETGDCFGNIELDVSKRVVSGMQFLPTFEMFRCEEDGDLWFEQRRWVGQTPAEVAFHPINIIHWRYRRKYLYGQALFEESKEDWGRYRDAAADLSQAARDVGLNPIIHSLPESFSKEQSDEYKRAHEMRLQEGIITNYYPYGGIDMKRLQTGNPDVKALIDNLDEIRVRFAMRSRAPFYMFGLQTRGAKEIAGQPALSWARAINSVRRIVGRGIRQAINTQLALNEIPKEKWEYQIAWPKIVTRVGETDEGEQADTESTNKNKIKPLRDYARQNFG